MSTGWVIFALSCVTFWGLWGFVGKLTMNRGMPYLTFAGVSSIGMAGTAFLVLLPFGAFHSGSAASLWLALLTGLLAGLGIIAFYGALERGPAASVVPLVALYPAVTLVLSVTLLHERLSPLKGLGIALTLVAAVLLADESGSERPKRGELSDDTLEDPAESRTTDARRR